MNKDFYDILEDSPVIAAVKNEDGLKKCIHSDIKIVFVLFGDICNISEIIKRLKNARKIALVHIDLVTGLSAKEISVDYIKQNTLADGIVSTRQNIINRAKDLSMFTVYRVFVIDSMALTNLEKQEHLIKADIIEVLPGVMLRVIKKVSKMVKRPVIAGGLITNKDEVIEALLAGAISISTTNQEVWFM
jgi:glycerol uptake operon antiterminator